jgi:hypothetical protein
VWDKTDSYELAVKDPYFEESEGGTQLKFTPRDAGEDKWKILNGLFLSSLI